MSTIDNTTTEARLVRNLAIETIKTDGKNGADRTSGPAFEEFAEDVKKHGVLQAVLVRALPGKGRAEGAYHLIAGHRRLAAAKRAGHAEIPAVVSDAPAELDEELRLVENLHRQDLHPLDEAEGYQRLLGEAEIRGGVAGVASRVGRSTRYVYDRLRFMQLTADAKRLFRQGRIEAGHAVILARLSAADQKRALDPNASHNHHAVFQPEAPLFDPARDEGDARETSKDPWDGLKARTANELQSWVDDHVRAEPAAVDPLLFPVTAEEIAAAKKVIPITRSFHLPDSAKTAKERTFGPQSWKRADGKLKSKTCALSTTGFVVAGDGRNESFAVCIAREKCSVHWGKEIKARAAKAAEREKKVARGERVRPEKQTDWRYENRKSEAMSKARALAKKEIHAAAMKRVEALTLEDVVRIDLSNQEHIVREYVKDIGGKLPSGGPKAWVAKAGPGELSMAMIYGALWNDYQNDVATALGVDAKTIVGRHEKAAAEAFKAAEQKNAAPAAAKKAAKPRKRGVAKK